MRGLHAHICPLPAQRTPIVMASLADNAGFVGAACLMRPSSNP
jgi:ROK family transcriptional repressor